MQEHLSLSIAILVLLITLFMVYISIKLFGLSQKKKIPKLK